MAASGAACGGRCCCSRTRQRRRPLWVLLAALCLWGSPTPTQAQSPPLAPTGDEIPPAIKTKAKRVVCVSYYNPVTQCSGDDDSQVWGYETYVFRKAAQELALTGNLEWAPGNWTWKCMPNWDQTLADIMKPSGPRTCDLFVGGVSATPERILAGVRFTHPTMAAGRRIMVHVNRERGTWSFLEPFTWQLWLAVFGTSAFVGLVLLVSETRWQAFSEVPGPVAQRAAGLQWGVLAVLLRTVASQLSPRTTAGRLILAGWAWMALILMNVYVSSLSAILTTRTNQVNIESMDDLVNEPVGIFIDDEASFQRFALNDVHLLPWSNAADEANLLRTLRSGEVKALVLDAPWVKYTAAAHCDLFIVGDMVLPVNLAFAFPSDVPEWYLSVFDSALTFLDDAGTLAQLERQYMTPPNPCHSPQGGIKETLSPVVELSSVAGLWVMLAACLAAALLWNGGKWLWAWALNRWLPPVPLPQKAPHGFHRASGSNGSLQTSSKASSAGGGKGALQGPLDSAGSGASSTAHAHGGAEGALNAAAVMGSCPTHDEALKAMERQMAQMDTLIRHMPFVMAAVMDARLSDLRAQLLAALLPQQPPFAHLAHASGGSGDAARPSLQQQSHSHLHRPHGTASSLQGRPSVGTDGALGPKSLGQVGLGTAAAPAVVPGSGTLAQGSTGAGALQAAGSSESGGWARVSVGTEQGEGGQAAAAAGGPQVPAQRTASGAN